jgi:molybdopterin-guanine dinucleotide biosynthesis protein A
MGRDKALLEVGGTTLVGRAVDALRHAGAAHVAVVGGDRDALAALGLRAVLIADDHPGEGPLGGLVTALRTSPAALDPVVVLSCDLPGITAAAVARLVAALAAEPELDVAAAARTDPDPDRPLGDVHPLVAAYRRGALAVAAATFAAGERRLRTAVADLRVRAVDVGPPAVVRNANRPSDLAAGDLPGTAAGEG